jgi:hypothetical protein
MDDGLAGILGSLGKFRQKREDGTSSTYLVERLAKVRVTPWDRFEYLPLA